MTPKRIAILVILAIVMLVVAVATWGSIGSMAMVFCLILMGLSLLYQHLTNTLWSNDYGQKGRTLCEDPLGKHGLRVHPGG